MLIVLRVPTEINFTTSNVKCYGVAGTDSFNLNCTTNLTRRTVNITNAVKY